MAWNMMYSGSKRFRKVGRGDWGLGRMLDLTHLFFSSSFLRGSPKIESILI